MAELREKSGPAALLGGLLVFVAFETLAYYLLRYLIVGLGQPDSEHLDNIIVSNWVKTTAFLLLHLALVIAAVLGLSNRLPRRYRGQIMGWFYLSLLMGLVLLVPLFST